MVQKTLFFAGIAVAAIFVAGSLAMPAYAHQRQLYTIGGKDFLMVIGSLNEPVFVDDKTGVDFRVLNADPSDPMNSSAKGATPVEGLEKTLKAELSAGGKTKELPLEPVFRDPGHYSAAFYPTVQTTYGYRIFGTINNTPVNLSFTCTAAGEAGAQASNATEQISQGVVRKGITGGYGCPEARTDVGFPEQYTSNAQTSTSLAQIQNDVSSIKATVSSRPSGDGSMVWTGVGLGIAGIAIGAVAMVRRK
jgi:hypothetical protein